MCIRDRNNTTDSTYEFDQKDIEQNKVMALLSYLGILVLVPLLGAKGSKYARFHTSQGTVSYTHLDVYKRQILNRVGNHEVCRA